MKSAAAYIALAVLAFPWWWPFLRQIVADVARAGASVPLPSERPGSHRPSSDLAPPRIAFTRTTPGQRRAFRSPARGGTRRRWEAGFGRRSL